MESIFKRAKTDDEELRFQEKRLIPSVMIEQTSAVLLGIINVMVVGTVSSAALAGVGQVNTVNNMVVYFFNAFAMGGTVMVAQNIGAHHTANARKSAAQSLLLGLYLSIFVTAMLFVFRAPFLSMLFGKVDADVMAYSLDYFLFSNLATPFWFINFQCAGAMRGAGDTRTPMRISLIMNAFNIVFSVLFVMVLGLGPRGAGLATFLSVGIGSALSLYTMFYPTYILCLRGSFTLKLQWSAAKAVTSVGIPAALENLMFNGGKVIVQVFLAGMGTVMISAYQVSISAINLLQIPMSALNVLVVTLVGQRAGAGDRERTYRALDYVWCKGFVWSLWIGAASIAACYPIALLFSRDPAVLKVACGLIIIFGVSMPFWSPAFIIPSGFRGARNIAFTMVVGTISMWVFRVFGSYVLGVVCHLAAYGIYIAMVLDWIVRTIPFVIHLKNHKWLRAVSALPSEQAQP